MDCTSAFLYLSRGFAQLNASLNAFQFVIFEHCLPCLDLLSYCLLHTLILLQLHYLSLLPITSSFS